MTKNADQSLADQQQKPLAATVNIAAREELVLGQPPRIPPLDPADVGEAALDNTRKLRKAAGGDAENVTLADVPEVVFTMLHHAELYEKIADLSIQLLGRGALAVRERELIVLRVAWLCQAPYEWGEHVKIARRVGISSGEIEQIIAGSSAANWNAHERALMAAVEELYGQAMISDGTWAVLAQSLSPKQLFELPILIGHFTNVAYFQNSFRLRLAPTNLGLNER